MHIVIDFSISYIFVLFSSEKTVLENIKKERAENHTHFDRHTHKEEIKE